MSQFFINQEKLVRVKKLSLQLHNAALFNQKQIEDYNDISSFIDGALKSTYVENLCLGQLYNMLLELHLDEFANIFKIIFQSQSINLKNSLQNLDAIVQQSESWQMKFQVLKKKQQQILNKENLDKENLTTKEKNLVQFETAMTNKEQQTALQIFNQEKKLNKEVNDIMEDIELGIFNKLDEVTNPIVLIRVNERISKNVLQLQRDSEQNVDKLLNHLNKTNQDSSNFEQIQTNLQKILDNFATISNPLDVLMLSSSHQLKKKEQEKFQDLKEFVEKNFTNGYMTIFKKIIKIFQQLKNLTTDSKLTQTTMQNDNFDFMQEEHQLQIKKLRDELTQVNVQNLDLQDSYFKAEANNEQLRKLIRKLQRENKDFKEFLANSNQFQNVYEQFLQNRQEEQQSKSSYYQDDEIEYQSQSQQNQKNISNRSKNNTKRSKKDSIKRTRNSQQIREKINSTNDKNNRRSRKYSKNNEGQVISARNSQRNQKKKYNDDNEIGETDSDYTESDIYDEQGQISNDKNIKNINKKNIVKNRIQSINNNRRNSSFINQERIKKRIVNNASQENNQSEYQQVMSKNRNQKQITIKDNKQQNSVFKKQRNGQKTVDENYDEIPQDLQQNKQDQLHQQKKYQQDTKNKQRKRHKDQDTSDESVYNTDNSQIETNEENNQQKNQKRKRRKTQYEQIDDKEHYQVSKNEKRNFRQKQNKGQTESTSQQCKTENIDESQSYYEYSDSEYTEDQQRSHSRIKKRKQKKRTNQNKQQHSQSDQYTNSMSSYSDKSIRKQQKYKYQQKLKKHKSKDVLQKNQQQDIKKIIKKTNKQYVNNNQGSQDSYTTSEQNSQRKQKRVRRKYKDHKSSSVSRSDYIDSEQNEENNKKNIYRHNKKINNKKHNKNQSLYDTSIDDVESLERNKKDKSKNKKYQKIKKTQKKNRPNILRFEEQTQTFYNFQCNKCNQFQHIGDSYTEMMQMAKQDNMRILNQIRFKKTERQDVENANYKSFEQMPQIEQLDEKYRFSRCFEQQQFQQNKNLFLQHNQGQELIHKSSVESEIAQYDKNFKINIKTSSKQISIPYNIINSGELKSKQQQNQNIEIFQDQNLQNMYTQNISKFAQNNQNVTNKYQYNNTQINQQQCINQLQNNSQQLYISQDQKQTYDLFNKRNSVQVVNDQKILLNNNVKQNPNQKSFFQNYQIQNQIDDIIIQLKKLPKEQKYEIIKKLINEIDSNFAKNFFQFLNVKKKQTQKVLKNINMIQKKSKSIYESKDQEQEPRKKSYKDLFKVSQIGFKTFHNKIQNKKSQQKIFLDIKKPQIFEREKEPIERKIQKVIYSFSVERKNKSSMLKTQNKNQSRKFNPSKLKLQILMKLEKSINIHSETLDQNNLTKTKALELIDEFSQVHNHCYPKCNHKERFIIIMQTFLQNSTQKELLKLPKILLNDNNMFNQFIINIGYQNQDINNNNKLKYNK